MLRFESLHFELGWTLFAPLALLPEPPLLALQFAEHTAPEGTLLVSASKERKIELVPLERKQLAPQRLVSPLFARN